MTTLIIMDDFVIVAFGPIQREQLGLEGEINAHAEFEANVMLVTGNAWVMRHSYAFQ